MKRKIQQTVHTDPTGEYCLVSCPQMNIEDITCDVFGRILDFKEVEKKGKMDLRPIRCKECKRAEVK